MNIITLYLANEILNILDREIKIDHMTCVSGRKQNEELLVKDAIQISSWSIKTGDYFKKLDWNTIKPLDKPLMEGLRRCQLVAYDMMMRLQGFSQPKLTYELRRKYYYELVRFWNDYLEKNRIDLVVYDTIPHEVYDYILYEVCKYKGIKTMMFYRVPVIPGKVTRKFILEDVFDQFPKFRDEYFRMQMEYEDKDVPLEDWMIEYFIQHADRKTDVVSFLTRKKQKRGLSVVSEKWTTFLSLMNDKEITGRQTARCILWSARRKINKKIINRQFQTLVDPILPDEKFFLMALHFQPELSTSPLAGVFVDQISMIRLIADVLPEGIFLYVKRHPRIGDFENLDFYKEVKRIKNVKLIDAHANSYELANRALGVVTATGTLGWEAIIRGIPVIVFGETFFRYFPDVYHVGSHGDCKDAVQEILSGKTDGNWKKNVEIFLKVMGKYSIPGFTGSTEHFSHIHTVSYHENNLYTAKAIQNYIIENFDQRLEK